MAKGKDIPEMFEAFRMQRGEQKPRESAEEKPKQEKPREAPAPGPVERKAPKRRPRTPEPPAAPETPEEGAPSGYLRRHSPVWLQAVMDSDDAHFLPLGDRAQVVFSLSYNALIVVIVVFVLFSLLIGFVGYTVGTRWPQLKGQKSVVGEEILRPARGGVSATRGGRPTRGGTPTRGGAPVATRASYTVKVLEVPNTPTRSQAVDRDIAFLKRQRVDPVVKQVNRRTNTIVLLAGAFRENEKVEAEQLKTRLRLMTVDGRREFKDAQVVPVP